MKNDLISNPAGQQIVITRVFDAPIDLVFRMWTEPQYLARWWGPKDFTNPVCEMDVRVSGAINIVMQSADGFQIPVSGLFQKIVAPELLVFTTLKLDAEGNAELEVLNTITLTETGGRTTLTMRAVVTKSTPEALASLQGMEMGWNQSLDRLAVVCLDVV